MKVRAHVGMFTKSFFCNDFHFHLSLMLGLMDFGDTANSKCVVGQIVVANKTLSVFISLYNLFSSGLFL